MTPRLLPLLLAALLGSAAAQSIAFGVLVRDFAPAASAEFRDFEAGGSTATLRVAAGPALELGLRLREAGSLAGVGNLVTSLAIEGSSAGRYGLAITARAVAGPLAARAALSLSDGGGLLEPLAAGDLGGPPALGAGSPLWALELGASYRLSADLVVDVGPAVFLRAGNWGGRVDGELRLLRLAGSDDLTLGLHAFLSPDDHSGAAALGVGYSHNRRRAPSWHASAWLGMAESQFSPGARLSGGDRIGPASFTLSLRAEPYRLDDLPYEADLAMQLPAQGGAVEVTLRGGLTATGDARASARLAYRFDVE